MKNNKASLQPIIEKIESLFSIYNKEFFEGQLQKPIITISPDTTKDAYGWCTSWKAWEDQNGGYYEINLCAEHLSRPIAETASTLLHEMVHLLNLQNGIQDTSRSGTYHNKLFKVAAEAHGLIVEQGAKYGWHKTKLGEKALEILNQQLTTKFELFRKPLPQAEKATKAKQSTRKYICPSCGCIIRATKEVHVICADCEVEFEQEI